MYFQRHKRMRTSNDESSFNMSGSLPCSYGSIHADKRETTHSISHSNDAFALPKLVRGPAKDKYGTVTKEYEKLHAQHMQLMNYLYTVRSSLISHTDSVIHSTAASDACDALPRIVEETIHLKTSAHEVDLNVNHGAIVASTSTKDKVKNGDSCQRTEERAASGSIIVVDSDEDGQQCQIMCDDQIIHRDVGNTKVATRFCVDPNYQPSVQYHQVILTKATKIKSSEQIQDKNIAENNGESSVGPLDVKVRNVDESDIGTRSNSDLVTQDDSLSTENDQEDDCETPESDGLDDLWKEMSLALEYSKSTTPDCSAVSSMVETGSEDCDHDYLPKDDMGLLCQICGDVKKSCDHDYLLKDDVGLVCRICGVIKKSITTIFDYQWRKGSQTKKTYISGSQKTKDADEEIEFWEPKLSEDVISGELSVHPRHLKQMKPHQIEGFNFLVRNLVGDNPGGCILAHAPGSGKTFMLISFIQSFLAKYPSARPLIILPKGLLPTWKREFQRWQVESIPLYDFYSVKADNRSQQLDVLKTWEENRSILFLGYKQFSIIVCDVKDKIGAACQERLLKVPSLLILDEGHTPRNEDTNILSTLAKVQTPRKVVLSGTLFQNHVKEVFNILNLVRQKFLKMETSRDAMRRILSRASIPGGSRRHLKADAEAAFFDIVEETLQNDDHFKRRVSVIQDLREMTQAVLHYYKGDFLDELPGHIDFTVLLNLSSKQKKLLGELENYEKFKRMAVGSAVYLHPCLKDSADYASGDRSIKVKDEEIDDLLGSIDVKDGVKTKFLLNILLKADSTGEKVLVFSQYILPLRFLERLLVSFKGWRLEKEIFMISGDTNTEQRELAMEKFNNSPDAKILLGSIKACGEGISLVGASRVVILDVHLNPSVSRQAIGRAFRPGQTKKVYTYRLVAADSPEEEDHDICFRKELISKMWFEWSEYCGQREFELARVDIQDSQDIFLAHLRSVGDIKALYRR